MKYVILSDRSWNSGLTSEMKDRFPQDEWIRIIDKKKFSRDHLQELEPDKIFSPHWSSIIAEEIFCNYECIVFHMTDLPFGRGGSPLQNLISRGYTETKISAIRVAANIDAGPVYLKKTLSLFGSAEEIFIRANDIARQMIVEIISEHLKPEKQVGEVVHFKRRKPADSNIESLQSIDRIYDFIRMLDAEGYPKAFIKIGDVKYYFSRASLKADGSIIADVRIYVEKQ